MEKWIIPCNDKHYDHRGAFSNLETIDWRQSTNIKKGDIVYIYVGKPLSCILYKCIVLESNIHNPDTSDNIYEKDKELRIADRYMRLKLIKLYKDNQLSYQSLMSNGLRTVQGPTKVTWDLENYIEQAGE